MDRTPFVAGNWKMNTTKASAMELAKAVAAGAPQGVEVGIAPPFVYLDRVSKVIAGSRVLLGAQDCYDEDFGAFTGEISAAMLKDIGARFCLSGHSERRHILHEPSDLVARKAAAVYASGMILIHCVGEKLAERDSGKTFSVVDNQLDELDPAKMNDPQRLVIAYEPVWAIGTGRNATDDQAQEMHLHIRDYLEQKWNADFATRVRIQYGGSMKPENAAGLLRRNDVDGGLIGGAALKAESFLAIAKAALQTKK
ncbi:MAG TPA: triose-phosphate isomerase [Tepidisphaeraceae bacterium]|nr:triose-phosphate isomerase [Tepidisphaeraceae bacterium]